MSEFDLPISIPPDEMPKPLEVIITRRWQRKSDPNIHYSTMPLADYLRQNGITPIYHSFGLAGLQWPG